MRLVTAEDFDWIMTRQTSCAKFATWNRSNTVARMETEPRLRGKTKIIQLWHQASYVISCSGPVWCGNGSLVHSSVEFILCVPVNQEAYCPFSSSSSSRAKTVAALSQSAERHSREGRENRKTQRCRNTHTEIPWLQLTVWGIMWNRWLMMLIRSLFFFPIVTSMSYICFVHSCECDDAADLWLSLRWAQEEQITGKQRVSSQDDDHF